MPTPGPRSQYGPDPGYRNPDSENLNRFNQWDRPGPVWWPGRSPGLMQITVRGCQLGAGQIRKLWRQSINYIPAQGAYSWTTSDSDMQGGPPLGITRALRYMTRSVYMGQGIDNSRYENLHTVVKKQNMYKTVTQGSGARNRPTVRNRMTSFGSRVPTLNSTVPAAEAQNPGSASQA
jgi:hypothetical protein